MITAWVFFFDPRVGRHLFIECNGSAFDSTDPKSWGLHEDCRIELVLHRASFMNAWVEGKERGNRA